MAAASREERQNGRIARHMVGMIYRQGQRLADVRHELERYRTSVAEFHCVMARTEIRARRGGEEGIG
jgi:hypothetical protein